jgi:hypothetical protein
VRDVGAGGHRQTVPVPDCAVCCPDHREASANGFAYDHCVGHTRGYHHGEKASVLGDSHRAASEIRDPAVRLGNLMYIDRHLEGLPVHGRGCNPASATGVHRGWPCLCSWCSSEASRFPGASHVPGASGLAPLRARDNKSRHRETARSRMHSSAKSVQDRHIHGTDERHPSLTPSR